MLPNDESPRTRLRRLERTRATFSNRCPHCRAHLWCAYRPAAGELAVCWQCRGELPVDLVKRIGKVLVGGADPALI